MHYQAAFKGGGDADTFQLGFLRDLISFLYIYVMYIALKYPISRRVFGCDAVHPEFQTNALNMVTRQTLDSHLTSQCLPVPLTTP